MRRLIFLAPAAVFAVVVASVAVVLDLGVTPTYVLIVAVGFAVVFGGILSDLGVFDGLREGKEVVKVHEAAIRAEEAYGPKPTLRCLDPGLVHSWDKEGNPRLAPFMVPASRASAYALFIQNRSKFVRVQIRPGLYFDPTPLTRA
jgi:hypothetical protein